MPKILAVRQLWFVLILCLAGIGGSLFAHTDGEWSERGIVDSSAPPAGPCTEFAAGPYRNMQNPPTGDDCGTPLASGFGVFGNESYLLNGQVGTEYEFSFCEGYDPAIWEAIITVARYDPYRHQAIPNTIIAWTEGCSLTFVAPTTDPYLIIVAAKHAVGGPEISRDNGQLTLTAHCPPTTFETDFAIGPLPLRPKGASRTDCGAVLEPGIQVTGQEAFLVDVIAGREYEFSFREGYDPDRWKGMITVARYNQRRQEVVPHSVLTSAEGCSLTFTARTTSTYIIIISAEGTEEVGQPLPENGQLRFTAVCPEPKPDDQCPAIGEVVITEFIQHPEAAAGAEGQWVEVFNTTDRTINLAGWSLQGPEGQNYTIDDRLDVLPQGYALLGNEAYYDPNVEASLDYHLTNVTFQLTPGESLSLQAPCQGPDEFMSQLVWEGPAVDEPVSETLPEKVMEQIAEAAVVHSVTIPSCPEVYKVSAGTDCQSVMPDFSMLLTDVSFQLADGPVQQWPAPGSALTSDEIVTLTFGDESNSLGQCAFVVRLMDNAAPEVHCPDNQVVISSSGAVSSPVLYAQPLAFDQCNAVAVTLEEGLPSGAEFPVGETVLRWRAEDRVGNVSHCSFTVTVEAPELADQMTESVEHACPEPIVLEQEAGAAGMTVDWIPPSLLPVYPGDWLISSHQPGDFFLAGSETMVLYLGVDVMGHVWEVCRFTVSVQWGDAAPYFTIHEEPSNRDTHLPAPSPPANPDQQSGLLTPGEAVLFTERELVPELKSVLSAKDQPLISFLPHWADVPSGRPIGWLSRLDR
ncbi:MAG: HYR domain-containing protein [Lewinella sp.]|nr:HYR domain-containing protein [Lewinella sp.]